MRVFAALFLLSLMAAAPAGAVAPSKRVPELMRSGETDLLCHMALE
mgnify:CR=1 FL=1